VTRPAVVMSWHPTWDEAVTEALRLRRVTAEKFQRPHVYVVRKRRYLWPLGANRHLWNAGRHDRWLVLTSANLPDRRRV